MVDLGRGNGALSERRKKKGCRAFQWMDEKDRQKPADNVVRQLKISGILVCEFGG